MIPAFITVALFIFCCFVLLLLRTRRSTETEQQFSGPWGFPIVGHLPFLVNKPHQKFAHWARKYGPVFRIRMGSRSTLIVNGHDAVKDVLVTQSDDFAARPDFYTFKFISNGNSMSFGPYGPSWKIHKAIGRTALSLFTQKQTKHLEAHVVEEADNIISELTSSKDPMNPRQSIHVATTSIVFSICFEEGRNIREDSTFLELLEKMDKFGQLVKQGGNIVDILPWTEPLVRSKTNKFISLVRDFGASHRFNQDRIRKTWTPHEPRNLSDALFDAAEDIGEEKLASMQLSKAHIMSLVSDVMGAGQATITTFLCWAIRYLIEFEGVQQKAHEEIDRELGPEKDPSYEDRTRLPFCEAIFLETQRFTATLPFLVPHAASRDCYLYGRRVPKGTMVMCNMRSVLRDPSVWERPDSFEPERFLDPQTGGIDRKKSEQSAAFGMGKRRCMGEFLGRLESFVFLVRILQRCTFRKAEAEEYSMDGVVGFAFDPLPYKVRVELR